ncbi:MAG: hypothetical protein IJH94_05520 [Clostridia bacterium]|nr:hypothetical protein [Clostridia bacterium]
MKDLFKRITIAVCAALAATMLATAPALATSEGFRSGPDDTAAVTDTANTVTDDTAAAEPQTNTVNVNTITTTDTSTNSVTAQAANTRANKKYLTKLGGFLWFLLSVLVNLVISYWLGSRFYKMAKRSAQGSNEIRALRKDIEEKFASTLKDIDEPAIDVINRNENYARDDEGLTMPDRRGHVELDEDEIEMMRRWDQRRAAPEREEDEERRSASKRSYQPTRKSSGIEFEEDEDSEESPTRREKATGKLASAKNKTKDFLSNVFPFDE